MKTTFAITLILSTMIALSCQNAAATIELDMPQALALLDQVETKFHALRANLAHERRMLSKQSPTPINFQTGVAEVGAVIAVASEGVAAISGAVGLFETLFDKFFDTSKIKAASDYMQANTEMLNTVDNDMTLKTMNDISTAMISLINVRGEIKRMTDGNINLVNNVVNTFDLGDADERNLTPAQKVLVFMQAVNMLDEGLSVGMTVVDRSRTTLQKVSTDMTLLNNNFMVLQRKFASSYDESSGYMEKQLADFVQNKLVQCSVVCVGSLIVGPFAVPICTACIALNYQGEIDKYETELRATLAKLKKDTDGMVAAFHEYADSSMRIKEMADDQVIALDDWETQVSNARSNITLYSGDISHDLPPATQRIRDEVYPLKAACLRLKAKFLGTEDPTLMFFYNAHMNRLALQG